MDVPEAQLEETEHGLVCKSGGWFVVNAREVRWSRTGDARISNFAGDTRFEQLGIAIEVLGPGEPMACYHREWDQEGFLVLQGSGTLVVEGEERPLRQWDYFHCPPGVPHTIVGAGSGPSAILAIGAREKQDGPDWGGYPYSDVAMKHDASAEEATTDPDVAYARFPSRQDGDFREDWLPT